MTASGLRLTYTWLQNGGALPNGGRFVTANEMLTIQNVMSSDAGSYSCVVSNAAGNDTSNSARLTLSELCICFVRDKITLTCMEIGTGHRLSTCCTTRVNTLPYALFVIRTVC